MNDKTKDKFLRWIGENYEQQRLKFQRYCSHKHQQYDEDIFADTILKVAEKISKRGLKDDTEKGFENYLFKSFKINMLREKQYSRNAKRDNSIEDVSALWKAYADTNLESSDEKLKSDLKQDFSVLYIANKVIENFGEPLAHIYLTKYFYNWTYKQLAQHFPNVPKLRDRLLEVKHFLQESVSKDEVDKAFWLKYDDMLN